MRAPTVVSAFPLAAALACAGCGRPATEAECGEILGHLVELELREQGVTDTAEIARRKEATLAGGDAGLGALRSGCVGKRITESALTCVRSAQTADEVTETCLR
jgi:hypothetical protein